jgi:hypothetical protein
LGQYGKNQSNTDIFRIGPIPVSPIITRSESARHFDNCKEKSREILDWLINKGTITWCFSYWPSYRSSVCCIGVRLRLRPIIKPIWKTSRNNTILFNLTCITPTHVYSEHKSWSQGRSDLTGFTVLMKLKLLGNPFRLSTSSGVLRQYFF